MLVITVEMVEVACRAFYNNGVTPIQYPWEKLVEIGDSRARAMRADMRAALEAVAEVANGRSMDP